MDELAALLDGPRARGAFVVRSVFDPPWSVRVAEEAPLSVLVAVRGDGWVVPDAGAPVAFRAGDVVVVRGPEPYTVADDPATEPRAVIHPGARTTTPGGDELCEAWDRGVRTWGEKPDGAAVLISGTYRFDGEVGGRLLAALPRVAVVPGQALVPVLVEEVGRDLPGQQAVLDRLLDLLLISALRARLAEETSWYRAHLDPEVGRALRLLHAAPERSWTVASLAGAVGVSRAALARRFTELVGEPPMAYLTSWRLTLAADLLREPGTTLEAVARRVGYGTAFAFSSAFKRVRGVSPSEFRRR
ncbi:AraC family transcriptional regulator [Saccharothrix syringae]|uniref:AraC family transcriptional regulator n=1 Tax=Saccharothrix syringae TaxID=103733 RepID=A0A5Q0GVC8_SACSY|nr:AraC family transcriptional regulator [Saccharothrix syringae]QFZ17312.1 AraC family transcriptional regulator [Saccharothrix syringae]